MKHTLFWIAGGLLLGGAGYLAYRQFVGSGASNASIPTTITNYDPANYGNSDPAAVAQLQNTVPDSDKFGTPSDYQVPTP